MQSTAIATSKPHPRLPMLSRPAIRAALTLLMLAGARSVTAQEHLISFEQISLEQGLSQSIVTCIAQDTRGFMWFGTEDGLNKYDGYSFTVYRHDPEDHTSIGYNHIISLISDRNGVIWIGLFLGGLDMFDTSTRRFLHYRHDPEDPSSLSNDMVNAIWEDDGSAIWVGTDAGLNRLDVHSGIFTRYRHDPSDPSSLGNDRVTAICGDPAGGIWVGTDGGGLCLLNEGTGAFSRYRYDPDVPGTIPDDEVRSLSVCRDGVLWVGTERGGVCRYDRTGDKFICYSARPGDPTSLSHNSVYAVHSDQEGLVWFGTNGGGLCRLDPNTGLFTTYLNNPNDPRSLSYNEVYSIFEDRSGVIWLGTYGGGINKFDTKRKRFVHYRRDPNDPNSLSHDIVWSILEDRPGYLWIGTHGGGLDLLDRKTNIYKHYRHDPNDRYSLSADIVRVVYRDHGGTLWIGTHGGGICRFDRATGRFHAYRNDPEDPRSISHDEIRSIFEDSHGILWIGTNGGGLNSFDRDTGLFTRYVNDPDDPTTLSNDFVRVIYEDGLGDFWLGTQGGGLDRMDRDTGRFTAYRNDPEDTTTINSDYVFSILEDDDGIFWMGTWGGGLVRFDRGSGEFTAYTDHDGLPSNSIYGVLPDRSGYLWMSTNNGLCRFDPRTGESKSYNEQDGLQSNEFNGGSYSMSPSGEMFFGGINGFNAFYPDQIRDNPYLPPVVITSFRKLNREVFFDKPISDMDLIRLSYRDYVISFEFAALEYSAPEKNRYAYKMEPLDEDWVFTDYTKRFANYTTLPPGRYVFRVKASNNDGIWNDEGASVRLLIVPPFWKTWWFRALTALVIIGIAAFLYRRRLTNMRMKIELQTAHDAQMSILPQKDPVIEGLEISGACIPAYEVGGDFYDYFWLDDDRTKLGIAVGDVSGKAMQAAMIAVMSSGMIYSKTDETTSPADVASRLNRALYMKTGATMYTALCLASLDVASREVTYTNAGFSSPLLRSNGHVYSLEGAGHGLPLGALDASTYREDSVTLGEGDVLVLFSDGVTEARNSAKDFYGRERLVRLLEETETAGLSASGIKDLIIEDARRFAGNAHQADDMTVVVLKATAARSAARPADTQIA